MERTKNAAFDPAAFLASAGLGRKIVQLRAKRVFFSQGDSAEAVFYIRKDSAKLTIVSKAGKKATITLLKAGDFVGEEAITAVIGLRLATADCTALRIERKEMIRVMHDEHDFSDLFVAFLLSRSMRT